MAEKIEKKINDGDVIDLSDITMIEKTDKKIMHKVEANEVLIIKDTIFNPDANIKVDRSGLRLVNPIFRDTFKVNMREFTVSMKDSKTNNGRYEQGVGQGDDISIELRIKCKVNDTPKALRNLMIQKEGYRSAIREAAETMMKLLVQEYYQKNSHKMDLSRSNELRNKVFDINAMGRISNPDAIIQTIIKTGLELTDKYGVQITSVNFVDVDESERIKNIKAENIEASNRRERELAEAKNKRDIAENEAEARKTKISKEIEALREAGLSDELIAQYCIFKNLPQNSIVSMGQGQNTLSEYMAANKILNGINKNIETTEELETVETEEKGKTR